MTKLDKDISSKLEEVIAISKARNRHKYKGFYTPEYVDKLTKKIINMEKFLNEDSNNRD